MKIFGTKKVKIGEREYPIEMTVWAMGNAEEIRGKPIDDILKLKTLNDRVALFYSCLLEGGELKIKQGDLLVNMPYDEFWKLIKDKPEAIGDFMVTFFTEEKDVKKK